MAHTLLGFNSYTCKEMKSTEQQCVESHGSLGRDSLSQFRFWSTKGTIVERAIRTTSEMFGPVGDHHGVNDLWEADCSAKGRKSIIGNYKDNRFNAIFQTAAKIMVHRHDFISVLEGVAQKNLKVQAVLADLKSDIIAIFMQCFAIMYVKVTGPFWNLVTSSGVSYLELHQHVVELKQYLEKCEGEPAILLNKHNHLMDEDPLNVAAVPHRNRIVDSAFLLQDDHRELLFSTVASVSKGMINCINKQLVDFLPGGKYSQPASNEDLGRLRFAPSTNLSCEHHFGDLDSRQRRRPSASMHHHSSVQLLKRNRTKMMQWLQNLPTPKRTEMMKLAKRGGKTLRELHLQKERNVLVEINQIQLQREPAKKKRKAATNDQENDQVRQRRRTETDIAEATENLQKKLPRKEDIAVSQYVAVAYEDSWYPGIVLSVKDDTSEVKFLHATRISGVYSWPSREDKQKVQAEYILKCVFLPEPVNSGRLWKIMEHAEIQEAYDEFRKIFFA